MSPGPAHAAQAIAVKVVNPGGISAFKFNQRKLDLDEEHVYYHVTPRQIILTLARAIEELGVTHPLHIHGCNLGVPGNIETTLATVRAAEGLRIHMTHPVPELRHRRRPEIFLGRGPAPELVNKTPMSRSTSARSCSARLAPRRATACANTPSPRTRTRKPVVMDIECDAGCGVVPMRYRDKSFVNAMQWVIGLETFLLFDDPWRIFLTTDHPNGAPFFFYPHLIRLLMDKGFRDGMLQKINPDAQPVAGNRLTANTPSTRSRS